MLIFENDIAENPSIGYCSSNNDDDDDDDDNNNNRSPIYRLV